MNAIADQSVELRKASKRLDRFVANYLESQLNLWDSYVDPRDASRGENGEMWESIGGGTSPQDEVPFTTCAELFEIQRVSRKLAFENEFAINGHTNRLNYIVGQGHKYVVVPGGAVARQSETACDP